MSGANLFELLSADSEQNASYSKKKSKKKVSNATNKLLNAKERDGNTIKEAIAVQEDDDFQTVVKRRNKHKFKTDNSNNRVDEASSSPLLSSKVHTVTGSQRSAYINKIIGQLALDDGSLRHHLFQSNTLHHILVSISQESSQEDIDPVLSLFLAVSDPSLPSSIAGHAAHFLVACGRAASQSNFLGPSYRSLSLGFIDSLIVLLHHGMTHSDISLFSTQQNKQHDHGSPIQNKPHPIPSIQSEIASMTSKLQAMTLQSANVPTQNADCIALADALLNAAYKLASLHLSPCDTAIGSASSKSTVVSQSAKGAFRVVAVMKALYTLLNEKMPYCAFKDGPAALQAFKAQQETRHASSLALCDEEESRVVALIEELERKLVDSKAYLREIRVQREKEQQDHTLVMQMIEETSDLPCSEEACLEASTGIKDALQSCSHMVNEIDVVYNNMSNSTSTDDVDDIGYVENKESSTTMSHGGIDTDKKSQFAIEIACNAAATAASVDIAIVKQCHGVAEGILTVCAAKLECIAAQVLSLRSKTSKAELGATQQNGHCGSDDKKVVTMASLINAATEMKKIAQKSYDFWLQTKEWTWRMLEWSRRHHEERTIASNSTEKGIDECYAMILKPGGKIDYLILVVSELMEEIVSGRTTLSAAAAAAFVSKRFLSSGGGDSSLVNHSRNSSGQSGRGGSGGSSASVTTMSTSWADMADLEHRLMELEIENKRKEEQILAMLEAASVEIPSPVPPPKLRATWKNESQTSLLRPRQQKN